MKANMLKIVWIMMLSMGVTSMAATIAYWDFEDGVAGQPFTPAGQPNGSGGSVDRVGGYMMRGWDSYYGPSWTDHTPTGVGLAMRNADHHQDGYSDDSALLNWAPAQWTIECAVKLVGGVSDKRWQTFIGRDGSAEPGVDLESILYLQKTWDNYFRINFRTADGSRYIATSTLTMEEDRWYRIAAASDGSTLRLWVNGTPDSSAGWVLAAETPMGSGDNALALIGANWTFGRGWYNNGFVDHINGYMDDIRLSDTALDPSAFLIPEPATMLLLGLGSLISLRKRN
ncbi:MAG TPA: LamG domain-containing protein [Anaerohalosphaeraceae bacterium]|nr:LamG domain-containing protein [Anaerohalosphaeraceae bacterium]HPB93358.1 LamG domain-containing protein [Anaerohalosphaeraceae bacterium]